MKVRYSFKLGTQPYGSVEGPSDIRVGEILYYRERGWRGVALVSRRKLVGSPHVAFQVKVDRVDPLPYMYLFASRY
jgi:hypothetical protein